MTPDNQEVNYVQFVELSNLAIIATFYHEIDKKTSTSYFS